MTPQVWLLRSIIFVISFVSIYHLCLQARHDKLRPKLCLMLGWHSLIGFAGHAGLARLPRGSAQHKQGPRHGTSGLGLWPSTGMPLPGPLTMPGPYSGCWLMSRAVLGLGRPAQLTPLLTGLSIRQLLYCNYCNVDWSKNKITVTLCFWNCLFYLPYSTLCLKCYIK